MILVDGVEGSSIFILTQELAVLMAFCVESPAPAATLLSVSVLVRDCALRLLDVEKVWSHVHTASWPLCRSFTMLEAILELASILRAG